MPLKLLRRHKSPNWYVRGSIRGLRVDESTGLSDRKAAQEYLSLREAELVRESIHGPQSVKTFAEAALSYMEAGGEREHLKPIIEELGTTRLALIRPDTIDQVAKKFTRSRSGKARSPATLNRRVYTPISAVLHHAAGRGWCPRPVIERPKQPEGRVRWINRDEAERLIEAAAPHLQPLVIFLLLTGARLSEALYLNWREVDLDAARVSLLETKNGESRGVPLHPRVIKALRALPHREGPVFRRPDGAPYASRGGLGGGQIKTGWAGMLRRSGLGNFRPHDCRHTWATWHYAANRDVFGLMRLGGWKSEKMVARYAHTNPDDLAPSIGLLWGNSRGHPDHTQENTHVFKAVA